MRRGRKGEEEKPSTRLDSDPRPLEFLLPRSVLYRCTSQPKVLPHLGGFCDPVDQGQDGTVEGAVVGVEDVAFRRNATERKKHELEAE